MRASASILHVVLGALVGLWLAAFALLAPALAGPGDRERAAAERRVEAPTQLRIELRHPDGQGPTGAQGDLGFLAGQVLAYEGELAKIDLILLLDVSGSTGDGSGIDVDGDGEVSQGRGLFSRLLGGRPSGGGDTILAAEISASRALMRQLDSRTTRVGLVIFSGYPGGGADALTEVGLTTDYRRIERALDDLSLVPPEGGTNLYAGLRLAARELLGRTSDSTPRKGAQRYVVLLTDGAPTLPGDELSDEPVRRAVQVAGRLRRLGIRVDSFALGPDAVDQPEAPLKVSRVTGGTYTAVRDLADLQARVQAIRFLDVARVDVRNQTSGADAECQILTPEGQFFALVPVRPGENRLRLSAASGDGTVAELERDVAFDPSLPVESSLDAQQRAQLALLRERCRRTAEPDRPGEPSRRQLEIEADEPDE